MSSEQVYQEGGERLDARPRVVPTRTSVSKEERHLLGSEKKKPEGNTV